MTEIYSFHFCFRILLFYFHLKKYEDFFWHIEFLSKPRDLVYLKKIQILYFFRLFF